MNSQQTLKAAKPGDYLWAYYAKPYSVMETHLLRVTERPFEDITKGVSVKLDAYGNVTTEEHSFNKDSQKTWRFAECSPWDAERWIADNAITSKISKKVVEAEVGFRSAIGSRNVFQAMTTEQQFSLGAEPAPEPVVSQDELRPVETDEEIPF